MPMEQIIAIIAGLLFGSHINVLICRLPGDMDLKGQRSMCPKCKAVLSALDLIPLLSYLMLRGRCRYCNEKISAQYPAVEALSAAFMLIAYNRHGLGLEMALSYIFMAGCLIVALTDLRTQIIPDKVTLPMLAVFLIASPFREGFAPPFGLSLSSSAELARLADSLLGALACGGFLLLLAEVTNGKMGGGDIKFIAAAGAYLGWYSTMLVLLLGSLSGLIVATLMIRRGKPIKGQPIPFGPYLAIAGVLLANISVDAIFYSISR